MRCKIILISDDNDFFEYIVPKLLLRNSDEIFRFNFDDFPDKLYQMGASLVIVNSENNQEKTLQLLSLIKDAAVIVFGYNNDEEFKIKAYEAGMLNFISISMSDCEIQAVIDNALKFVSVMDRTLLYRDLLVKNNLIIPNNEVFIASNSLIDDELNKIHKNSINAVFGAICPDDKSKFLLNSNQIETAILNNIRENDLLINFAANKYYLLLYNTDVVNAQKIWEKIASNFSEPVLASFVEVKSKKRQQLINEVLNKLHGTMHNGFKSTMTADVFNGDNFKLNKNNFYKKIECIISPVLYHIQQVYSDKLFNMNIEVNIQNDSSILNVISKQVSGSVTIACHGYSTVNIDITFEKNMNIIDSRRISLEPDELEQGLLQDIIEQFIIELKTQNEVNYDNIEP